MSSTDIIRNIIVEFKPRTQKEILNILIEKGHEINQSTISRTLGKLGAVRSLNANGQSFYGLPKQRKEEPSEVRFKDLIVAVEYNESLIVIHTKIGSAPLVAQFLDENRPSSVLGTLAGDDTIFLAPKSIHRLKQSMQDIERLLKL